MAKLEGITIAKTCPERFSWRGNSYRKKDLTQDQGLRLAKDPKFIHISVAKQKEKPPEGSAKDSKQEDK